MHTILTRSTRLGAFLGLIGLVPFACAEDVAFSDGSGGSSASGGTSGGQTGAGGKPGANGGSNNGGATTGGQGEDGSGGQGGEGGESANSGGSPGSGGALSNPVFGPIDCTDPTGEVPLLELEPVVSDLSAPIFIDHIPGDDRMFVVLYTGSIQIYQDGALLDAPFLDLGAKVTVGGERGLLGFALHPDYPTNGLFYVHYSAGSDVEDANTGDTIIEEYHVSDDANVADSASARRVLTVAQPYGNHNGGAITFGPDRLLYIGLGDGGSGGDPQGHGQDPDLLGSLLRIDPLKSGDKPYTSPPGNYPGASPEVFSIGTRNPFRYTFDGCNGDLYIGDVGQDTWEEIDFLKGGESGKNFGWNTMEGTHCFPAGETDCSTDGLVLPIAEHNHSESKSITGGSVYRGTNIPALRGAYFYADYSTNRVWWLRVDRNTGKATAPVSVTQDLSAKSIVAIETGPDGELYFVSIGGIGDTPSPGGVYRLKAAE